MKPSPIVQTIKDEMGRQDFSVQELAKKANISFTNLYDIFSGEVSPTLETIEKLSRALKLKVTAA